MWAAVTFSSQGKMGSRSADIRRVDLSGGHPLGRGAADIRRLGTEACRNGRPKWR